jgi:DNA-binding LacI/PurR family transcriptional regulator
MAKIGIKDIAARAGVSIATVSHSFRNPGRVSDATREKVLAAADEIGYSPNSLAASLRTARSGNIVAMKLAINTANFATCFVILFLV